MHSTTLFSLSAAMDALGWTLLHSLWQGAVVGLLLAVLFALLPRRHASLRYSLAVAGLFALIGWTGMTFLTQYMASLQSGLSTGDLLTSGSLGLSSLVDGKGETGVIKPFLPFLDIPVGWVAALWVLGALGYSLRWAGSLWYLLRLRQAARPAPKAWQLRFDVLSARLRTEVAVPLLISAQARVPMVVGYLKPAILVPAGMLTGLRPEQVEAILIHELAHVRRYDYLINLVQSVAEILFFYHPAFWWLNSRLQEEREHCCDDIAVNYTGDALAYARALTDLAALGIEEPHLALGFAGRHKQLLGRIQRLLNPAEPPLMAQTRLLTGMALALTLLSLTWIQPVSVNAREQATALVVPAPEATWQPAPGLQAAAPLAPARSFFTATDTPPPPPPAPPAVPEIDELPPIPPLPDLSREMPDYLNPGEAPDYLEEAEWKEFEKSMREFEKSMKAFEEGYMKDFQQQHKAYQEKMAAWQMEFMAKQEYLMQQLQEEFSEEKVKALAEELARSQERQDLSQEERRRLETDLQREMERAEQAREKGLQEAEKALREMERELRQSEAEEMKRQEEALRRQQEALHQQEAALKRQEEMLRQQEAELKEMEKAAKRELINDGLIPSADAAVDIRMTEDSMTLNGKEMDDATFQKYRRLLGQEGKLGKGSNVRIRF